MSFAREITAAAAARQALGRSGDKRQQLWHKVGTGIGSGLIGWVLALGHYDGALAVQPASAVTAEIVLVLVVPLVTGILRTICASMWDLN